MLGDERGVERAPVGTAKEPKGDHRKGKGCK